MTRGRRAALLIGMSLLLGSLAAADVARREDALNRRLAPLIDVVVAAEDLDSRHKLKLADMAIRRIPAMYAPVGAALSPAEIAGRELAVAVQQGGTLGASQLADPAAGAGAPVGRGERAVEILGLGSAELVAPGARVDVLVTHDSDTATSGRTDLALEDIEVLDSRHVKPTSDEEQLERVAATLRVSVRQAVYLASAQSFAREVRLLPRAAGDSGREASDRRRKDSGHATEALGSEQP